MKFGSTESRNQGDYERTKPPEQSQAENAIAGAEKFIARVAKLLGEAE